MQKVIYVPPWDVLGGDDNVALQLAEPFILGTISGTSGTDADIQGDTIPGLDGVYLRNVRLESGLVKATINVHGASREDMYRQRFELIRCLTPKSTPGTLYYSNDYISAKIAAIPQSSPQFTTRKQNYNEATVEFFAPSPAWEAITGTEVKIAWIGKALEFSFEFADDIEYGVIQSVQNVRNTAALNTPIVITISAPATTPIKLRNNTTNQTIELEHSLDDGEQLIINTKRGNKSVTLVHLDGTTTDAFNYITPDSELFELIPGNNEIEYVGWDESEPTAVTITYNQLYSGV